MLQVYFIKTKEIMYKPVTLQQKKQPTVREKCSMLCMSKANCLQSLDSAQKTRYIMSNKPSLQKDNLNPSLL